MLYAFNAASLSPALWSLNLGSPVVCSALPPGVDYDPCKTGVLGPYAGVTGTPVIDMGTSPHPTLYVSAAIQSSTSILFYLFAVDITTGLVRGTTPISGMVPGESPDPTGKITTGDCTSDYPGNGGQITFEYHHTQRAALLLLNGTVYVAFSGGLGNQDGETTNGWIFGYQFNSTTNTFSPTAVFNSTPYGTGGGIWGSGAGPASDGTNIYAAIANGTLFDPVTQSIPYDLGDSLVKLDPSNHLNVLDFYAPPDGGAARCKLDLDFGSGGTLVFPDAFYHDLNTNTYPNLLVNADKDSKLYITNQANLGKFNASGGNNIQTVLTPVNSQGQKLDSGQGYWGSPAYWKYPSGTTTNYMLYYSATTQTTQAAPYPLSGFQLLTSGSSGPIASQTPTMSTSAGFCYPSPTPSVSWNSTDSTTGIVWVIEKQNAGNVGSAPNCAGTTFLPAALHAFKATNLAAPELYNSSKSVTQTMIGPATSFSVPTIFRGRVYMGTKMEVDVFGLCSSQQTGCKP